MQTNNNNFIPQATTSNEHERTSNMGWLMLLVGFLLGCLIAGGTVFALFSLTKDAKNAETAIAESREIKGLILEKMESEYSGVLEEHPVALDASDIYVVPSVDVAGEYDVFALLASNDAAFVADVNEAVREGHFPSGTKPEDLRRTLVFMKVSEKDTGWEVKEFNAFLGQSFWFMQTALRGARDKGRDAAIKSTINNLRAQAELYYDDNDRSYSGLENDQVTAEALRSVTDNSPGSAQCKSSVSAYRCSAPLVKEDSFYCIDDSGFAGVVSSDPADISGYDCP